MAQRHALGPRHRDTPCLVICKTWIVQLLPLLIAAAAISAARATYSIIARDKATGTVGCAVTSCLGSCAASVAAQVKFNPRGPAPGREEATKELASDATRDHDASRIIHAITDPSFDSGFDTRQCAVCPS